MSSETAIGGGAQRPVLRVTEPGEGQFVSDFFIPLKIT
jgi:hypothetical protein